MKPIYQDCLTDALTAQAVHYLEKRAAESDAKPFFLHFCHFAVHTPIQGKKDLIAHHSKIFGNHKPPCNAPHLL